MNSQRSVKPAASLSPPTFLCGGCHDPAATVLVVVCRACGKQICADCALDDELQTLRCYVCLDSSYQGRKLRGGARRRR